MPKRQLTHDEAICLLTEERIGQLATCTTSGAPYITPVNYLYYQDRIYFHCAKQGIKLENIAANDQVCFCVYRVEKSVFSAKACNCSTRYRSVLVFGRASLVDDENRKVEILNALTEKHSDGQPFQPVDRKAASHVAVVEITIDEMQGKLNADHV